MPTTLFTAQDLTDWLQYEDTISEGTHTVIHKVVTGWVLGATGWTELPPDPVPEQLYAWALELGGIAYENPTDQSSDQTANVLAAWRDRRSQILAELKLWAKSNPAGMTLAPTGRPRGTFPTAAPYPDPACPYGMR